MLIVTPQEMRELRHCLSTLEAVLANLDHLGAGIAAIHVDAAVNQLKGNLEVIIEDSIGAAQPTTPCQSECRPFLP